MNKILFFFFIITVVALGQTDTTNNNPVSGENEFECIDNIYKNPEAIKYLLRKIVNDKDLFNDVYKQVINDPAMKNIIKEMRGLFREDRGMLERKTNSELNKAKNELTFCSKTPGFP